MSNRRTEKACLLSIKSASANTDRSSCGPQNSFKCQRMLFLFFFHYLSKSTLKGIFRTRKSIAPP